MSAAAVAPNVLRAIQSSGSTTSARLKGSVLSQIAQLRAEDSIEQALLCRRAVPDRAGTSSGAMPSLP
jgi:hypothetical protein